MRLDSRQRNRDVFSTAAPGNKRHHQQGLRRNDSGDDPVSRRDEGEASMSEHVENEERDQQTEESPEAERAGEYEQSGSLGTAKQGDSIARELADRQSDSN
jgi:hypothetical protein